MPDKILSSARFSGNKQLENAATGTGILRRGASGSGVKLLQEALADLRFLSRQSRTFRSGSGDGQYGDETASAVVRFQRENRLQPDGSAGPETLKRLDKKIAEFDAGKVDPDEIDDPKDDEAAAPAIFRIAIDATESAVLLGG